LPAIICCAMRKKKRREHFFFFPCVKHGPLACGGVIARGCGMELYLPSAALAQIHVGRSSYITSYPRFPSGVVPLAIIFLSRPCQWVVMCFAHPHTPDISSGPDNKKGKPLLSLLSPY
jgi:hypothetical protein